MFDPVSLPLESIAAGMAGEYLYDQLREQFDDKTAEQMQEELQQQRYEEARRLADNPQQFDAALAELLQREGYDVDEFASHGA